MEDVDYGRAWMQLKVEIGDKPRHGRDQLLALMGRIEVDNADRQRLALNPTSPETPAPARAPALSGPQPKPPSAEEADHGSRNGSTVAAGR